MKERIYKDEFINDENEELALECLYYKDILGGSPLGEVEAALDER